MAPFNPPVKETNTNVPINSKAIEDPKPDLSLGALFKGIGDTLETGAKGIDQAFKGIISDQLYGKVGKVRQDATDQIGALRADVYSQNPSVNPKLGSNPDGGGGEEDDSADTPDELDGLGDKVSNLSAASKGGKISLSQYWMSIDNIAKDYRSRFPGYREYIDQTVSSITGHNPANAFMSSMIQDITRGMAGTTKVDPEVRSTNTMIDAVTKMGVTDAEGKTIGPSLYAAYASGKGPMSATTVRQYVANNMAPKFIADRIKDDFANREIGLKGEAITADTAASEYGVAAVNSGMRNILLGGNETIKSISEKAVKMQKGESMMDPEQINKFAYQLEAGKSLMADDMFKFYTQPMKEKDGTNGRSLAQRAAGTGDAVTWANAKVAANMKPVHDIISALRDKNVGLAAYHMQAMEAQATNDKYNSLKTDAGLTLRMFKVWDQYPAELKELLKTTLINKTGNVNIGKYVQDMTLVMSSQPDKEAGKIYSVDEAVKKASAAGVKSPEIYKDFAEHGLKILNPKLSDDIKLNVAASMFHPANLKFLQNFTDERREIGEDGKEYIVPGKIKVWRDYTSPAMVAEIKRLSGSNPQLAQWYKQWTENAMQSDLFGQNLRDLKQIGNTPGINFSYNNTTQQIGWEFDTSTPEGTIAARQRNSMGGPLGKVRDTIAKANEAMAGIRNAAEVNGYDTPEKINGYVLGLVKSQLGPDAFEPKVPPKNVGDSVGRAIGDTIVRGLKNAAGAFNPLAGGSRKPAGALKSETPTLGTPQEPETPHFTAPERVQSPIEFQRNPLGNNSPAPKAQGGSWLSQGDITNIQVDDIPDGMSARDFIRQLKAKQNNKLEK